MCIGFCIFHLSVCIVINNMLIVFACMSVCLVRGIGFVLQVETGDVFLVTALMNNETVFSAEINLNG